MDEYVVRNRMYQVIVLFLLRRVSCRLNSSNARPGIPWQDAPQQSLPLFRRQIFALFPGSFLWYTIRRSSRMPSENLGVWGRAPATILFPCFLTIVPGRIGSGPNQRRRESRYVRTVRAPVVRRGCRSRRNGGDNRQQQVRKVGRGKTGQAFPELMLQGSFLAGGLDPDGPCRSFRVCLA